MVSLCPHGYGGLLKAACFVACLCATDPISGSAADLAMCPYDGDPSITSCCMAVVAVACGLPLPIRAVIGVEVASVDRLVTSQGIRGRRTEIG